MHVVDLQAREAQVIVPDYQLSLAIGKEGQNVRLAARLTGWRIDIRADTAVPRADRVGGGGRRGRRMDGRSGQSCPVPTTRRHCKLA